MIGAVAPPLDRADNLPTWFVVLYLLLAIPAVVFAISVLAWVLVDMLKKGL